jgi:hypothetical protein
MAELTMLEFFSMNFHIKTSDRAESLKILKVGLLTFCLMFLIFLFLVRRNSVSLEWEMIVVPIIAISGVLGSAYHLWWCNKQEEVFITDKEFGYFDGKSWLKIDLVDIQEICIKCEDSYFFRTRQGALCRVPTLHSLSAHDIIEMVCELNPAIDVTEYRKSSFGELGRRVSKWLRPKSDFP